MSPTLTSVEKIIKGKEEYLRFYVKDPNFYTDYLINTKKNGCRFIIKPCYRNPLDEGNKTYYLIEEVSQVDMRLKSTEDFKYCIFLIDADFRSFSFVKKSNFYRAIFTQHANFSLAVFNQIVVFSRAKFMQDVDFSNAEFTQSTYFLGAKFIKNVNFFNARIHHIVNFAYATIGSLDLSHAIIERIMYEDIVLTSANRQTFLIFKNMALKQNDQIKALKFHINEYQEYLVELRKNKTVKNFLDRFILTFESWASTFSTSVIRSITRLVGIVLLFYVLINGFNYDAKTIIDFASPLSYDIDKMFTSVSDTDRYLFFFYKILQVVLIYEIIKSFRKFSRAL